MRTTIILLLFTVTAACQPAVTEKPTAYILYHQSNSLLTISPGHIPVESPLRLSFQSVHPLHSITAELTGLSMYMGRIPVVFTPVNAERTQWQAEFILGACSDPAMQWQLDMTLTSTDKQNIKLIQSFKSSW